jgi:hypothetical protein
MTLDPDSQFEYGPGVDAFFLTYPDPKHYFQPSKNVMDYQERTVGRYLVSAGERHSRISRRTISSPTTLSRDSHGNTLRPCR